MTMADQDFWKRTETAAPGMLQLGAGLWGTNAARREGKDNLAAAQGPEYAAAMGASQGALAQAGSMDPKAAAQERFNAAQGMLASKDATDMQSFQRMLQKQGQGGMATYGGVEPGGAPINPQMAAYFAEKNKRDAALAYHSLREGEDQTDRMLNRSSALQNQANQQRASTLGARKAVPSKAAGTANFLKSGIGLAKDTGLLSGLPGMLKGGFDWLGGSTGLWGGFDAANMNLSDMKFGFDDMDGIA
jgi:hypothetical protein